MNHLKNIAARAASYGPDALMIAGAGGVSYGASLVYLPSGWVVGGLFALAGGWLLARGEK